MVSARYTRETKTAFRKGGCFTQFDGFGNSAMVSTRYAPRETKTPFRKAGCFTLIVPTSSYLLTILQWYRRVMLLVKRSCLQKIRLFYLASISSYVFNSAIVSTSYDPRKTKITWPVGCPAGPPDEKYTSEISFSYANTRLRSLPKEKNKDKQEKT